MNYFYSVVWYIFIYIFFFDNVELILVFLKYYEVLGIYVFIYFFFLESFYYSFVNFLLVRFRNLFLILGFRIGSREYILIDRLLGSEFESRDFGYYGYYIID